MTALHAWLALRYSNYNSEDASQQVFLASFEDYLRQRYAWVLHDGLSCFTSRAPHWREFSAA